MGTKINSVFGIGLGLGTFLDLLIYFIVLFLLYRAWNNRRISNASCEITIFLIVLFCIMPYYAGDFVHYYEAMKNIVISRDIYSFSVEPVYVYLAKFLGGSYILWRLVIWGTAIYAIILAGKILHLRQSLYLLIFFCCFITNFAYARVSLAMASVFLGLSLIISSSRNTKRKIFGLCLILVSYYFHKSALFAISIAFFSLLIPRLSKFKMMLLIGLIPFFIFIINFVFSYVLNSSIGDESLINIRTTQHYLSHESQKLGLGSIIGNFLIRAPLYILGFYIVRSISNDSYRKWSKYCQFFATVSLLIILSASLFLLDFGDLQTQVIYYRFLNFSFIPVTIFMTLHKMEFPIRSKLFTLTFKMLIIGQIYQLVYSFYLNSL